MSSHRYRYSRKRLDLGFVFGALGASALPGPVLVRLLGAVGTAESAARNLLTAATHRGVLTAVRHGRYTVYRLSPTVLPGHRQAAGTAAPPVWTGSFHTLLYDVPESERKLRDQIRYAADFAGYGLLRAGVLISPEDRRERFDGLLGELPAGCRMYPATLQPVDLEQARRMTRDTWDLAKLAHRYRRAADRLRAVDDSVPDTCWEALQRGHAIYRQTLDLQLSDPGLPRELLPDQWPQLEVTGALDRINRRWGPVMQPQLRAAAAQLDPTGLAVYYTSAWDT